MPQREVSYVFLLIFQHLQYTWPRSVCDGYHGVVWCLDNILINDGRPH